MVFPHVASPGGAAELNKFIRRTLGTADVPGSGDKTLKFRAIIHIAMMSLLVIDVIFDHF
jgi:hypothetical protein